MSFQFKQFSIEDERCAMKIGTDGCLLGAWTDINKSENILDIGTGSGVVALMLAQRSNAKIDAVEIDNEAFLQASDNFLKSPWNERLHIFHSSIQEYTKSCDKKYDLIVSCPPYFLNSMKAPDKQRKLARHTDSLTFEELLSASLRLLKPDGKFCVIIPFDLNKLFCDKALIEGYYVSKATHMIPKEGKEPLRILLQMEREKKSCTCDSITILDKTGKSYTQEYIELTKDFYINF